MSEIAEFASEIEAFLKRHSMSPSKFGSEIAGDPQFVFDLRGGREPRSDTRQRIRTAMENHAVLQGGKMPNFRIGIAGLGTVGAALIKMVHDNGPDISRRLGKTLEVTSVSARSRDKDRGVDLSAAEWFNDPVAIAREAEIDLFVELIGGEDGPALAAVEAALSRGVPVVTANKALLAKHGIALAKLAEANNTTLGFEAAVAGGIPIIKTLREGLGSARINRVYGIMNGTCNYILTRMGEEGISFADCLKDAQALGYAEADPAFDIEGNDTAHKLAILTTLCFECEMAPEKITLEGITKISQVDIKVAADLGYKIKLLGIAERVGDGIEQRVHPTLVPRTSAIAGVDGVLNAIALETNHVAELMMVGPGAGGDATAASVLSDVLDIVRGLNVPPLGLPTSELSPFVPADTRAHSGGFYIRLALRDVPGALAAITARMASQGISLQSVIQRPDLSHEQNEGDEQTRVVILITHDTTEANVRLALSSFAGDGFTSGETQVLHIEEL